jgi:hypothetical protein
VLAIVRQQHPDSEFSAGARFPDLPMQIDREPWRVCTDIVVRTLGFSRETRRASVRGASSSLKDDLLLDAHDATPAMDVLL